MKDREAVQSVYITLSKNMILYGRCSHGAGGGGGGGYIFCLTISYEYECGSALNPLLLMMPGGITQ